MSIFIERLKKSYQSGFTMEIEALEIKEGRVNCVIGPSGGGKSTLLRAFAGLDEDCQIKLQLFGQEKNGVGDYKQVDRREMAFVTQRPAILHRSVRENIRYPLDLFGVKRGVGNKRVEEVAKLTGLGDKLDRNAQKLSGGEMQRLSLARALVTEPKLLILDEPTANLDPQNVAMLEELICRVNEERKITILMVTHNMFQAKRIAHQLILLMDGKVVAVGENNDFFSPEASEQIRRFVNGEMIY